MSWQHPLRPLRVLLFASLLLSTATTRSSSAGRKSVKYRTTYYVPAEHRSSYYDLWPYQDPKLSRRSYSLWDDSYDFGGGSLALLPSIKGILGGANKQKHFHHHYGGKHGCGIEVALLGLVLFLPLIGILGIVMPLVLLFLPLLLGIPALLQQPWALGPIIGVPGSAVGTQGRRRRATPAPILEDVVIKTVDVFQKALAKYNGL